MTEESDCGLYWSARALIGEFIVQSLLMYESLFSVLTIIRIYSYGAYANRDLDTMAP